MPFFLFKMLPQKHKSPPSEEGGSRGLRRAAVLLPLAGVILLGGAGCKQEVQHSPDVWAVVNGKEIKRDDVDKYYRTRVNPEGQAPSQEEVLSLKMNVLDELINNEILLERAKKLNLEASDGEVEDKFTEMKSPYTEEEFQRQLKERGLSVDDLKKGLKRQLSTEKLLNREVVAKISITDQDVTDFYNANKAQFNVAEPQYRIAQIVVTPRKEPQIRNRKNDDATNEAEAQRKIKMLMDRLNSGADFAHLADQIAKALRHAGECFGHGVLLRTRADGDGQLSFGDGSRDGGHFLQVDNHLVEIVGEHAYFIIAVDIDGLIQIAGLADSVGHLDEVINRVLDGFCGPESNERS